MAPLPAGECWAARLDRFGFWLFDAGIVIITWIFLVGDMLMTGRLIFIGAAAVYDRIREKILGKPAEVASYKPKVAVLIPAYNEEKVIERTVRAALNSNYPQPARHRDRRRIERPDPRSRAQRLSPRRQPPERC